MMLTGPDALGVAVSGDPSSALRCALGAALLLPPAPSARQRSALVSPLAVVSRRRILALCQSPERSAQSAEPRAAAELAEPGTAALDTAQPTSVRAERAEGSPRGPEWCEGVRGTRRCALCAAPIRDGLLQGRLQGF